MILLSSRIFIQDSLNGIELFHLVVKFTRNYKMYSAFQYDFEGFNITWPIYWNNQFYDFKLNVNLRNTNDFSHKYINCRIYILYFEARNDLETKCNTICSICIAKINTFLHSQGMGKMLSNMKRNMQQHIALAHTVITVQNFGFTSKRPNQGRWT